MQENRRRTCYIVLIFIFSSVICFSQSGTIKGSVKDALSRKSLVGAKVYVVGKEISGIADEMGKYILQNVPEGAYDLKVSYTGYRDAIMKNVSVSKNAVTEFEVEIISPEYNNICPVCEKSDKVIPIVYGYPSKKLLRQVKRGKVTLGGCMLYDNCPYWYCSRDKELF